MGESRQQAEKSAVLCGWALGVARRGGRARRGRHAGGGGMRPGPYYCWWWHRAHTAAGKVRQTSAVGYVHATNSQAFPDEYCRHPHSLFSLACSNAAALRMVPFTKCIVAPTTVVAYVPVTELQGCVVGGRGEGEQGCEEVAGQGRAGHAPSKVHSHSDCCTHCTVLWGGGGPCTKPSPARRLASHPTRLPL